MYLGLSHISALVNTEYPRLFFFASRTLHLEARSMKKGTLTAEIVYLRLIEFHFVFTIKLLHQCIDHFNVAVDCNCCVKVGTKVGSVARWKKTGESRHADTCSRCKKKKRGYSVFTKAGLLYSQKPKYEINRGTSVLVWKWRGSYVPFSIAP